MKTELPVAVRKYDGLIVAILTACILALGGWVIKTEARMSVTENAAQVERDSTHRALARVESRVIRLDDKIDRLLLRGNHEAGR